MTCVIRYTLLFTSLILISCNAPENEALGANPFKKPTPRPAACDGSRLRLTKTESGVGITKGLSTQVENNQTACRRLQAAFEGKRVSVTELWPSQTLPASALESDPSGWSQTLTLPDEDAEIQVTDVHSIEYTENYDGCTNHDSIALQKHVCLLPSAATVNSTKISIHLPPAAKRAGELQEVTRSSSGAVIRGGVRWDYEQVFAGTRSFDGLMFHWFLAPSSSKLEGKARGLLGNEVNIRSRNAIESIPSDGCQIRAIQVSADGFKESTSVWMTRSPEGSNMRFEELCAATRSFFQSRDLTTEGLDPWKIYEVAPVVPLLTGVYVLPYDGSTGSRLNCDPDIDCPLVMEASVRKILSQALSPSTSKGSLWVRFFWVPQDKATPVMTTVRLSVESGEIQETVSRFLPDFKGLPQVQ